MYKYPSEMVIISWLPQMLDNDILTLMLLMGDPNVQFCSQLDYFEKLIAKNSILLKMSPERKQNAMALQVLMQAQITVLKECDQGAADELLTLLVRSGMIDERFGSVMQMRYVEHTESNCYILAQVYLSAVMVFSKLQDAEVVTELKSNLKQLVEEFVPMLDFVENDRMVDDLRDDFDPF